MKILIADPSTHSIEILREALESHTLEITRTGPEALAAFKAFKPDLIIIDLMLPIMHGIELLHIIRTHGNSTGVIMTSFQMMVQNYRAAIEAGADYYLTKPFKAEQILDLVERFQNHSLKPDPFELILPDSGESCYNPTPSTATNYLKFWGTRGSNPVAGAEYVRYGGNTCSLEVRSGDDVIIVDAGTGIRKLGDTLTSAKTIHLFIGHTHWDHITGFPFFTPLYRDDCNIVVYAPVGFEKSTKQLFTDMLAYAYFPVRLDEMHSKVIFRELRDHKPIKIGDITIEAHPTNHPGPTFGFRITSKRQSIGYITDNELFMGYMGHPSKITRDHTLMEPHLGLLEFLEDCETIIHEAQYLPSEYHEKIGWGHSSVSNAVAFIQHLKCIDWIVTHHDPTHTDAILQDKNQIHLETMLELDLHPHCTMAYDGLIVSL